jgi:hypothetical protein
MTPNEIIEMARQAGAGMLHGGEFALFGNEKLEAFAKLVAAKEREACARIVEVEAMQYAEPVWAYEIVNDIRARGEQA